MALVGGGGHAARRRSAGHDLRVVHLAAVQSRSPSSVIAGAGDARAERCAARSGPRCSAMMGALLLVPDLAVPQRRGDPAAHPDRRDVPCTSTHLLVDAGAQIRDQAVPVPDHDGLLLLTTLGVGSVAILVDLVAVGLRRPALAGLPMLAIYSVPVAVLPRTAVGAAVHLRRGRLPLAAGRRQRRPGAPVRPPVHRRRPRRRRVGAVPARGGRAPARRGRRRRRDPAAAGRARHDARPARPVRHRIGPATATGPARAGAATGRTCTALLQDNLDPRRGVRAWSGSRPTTRRRTICASASPTRSRPGLREPGPDQRQLGQPGRSRRPSPRCRASRPGGTGPRSRSSTSTWRLLPVYQQVVAGREPRQRLVLRPVVQPDLLAAREHQRSKTYAFDSSARRTSPTALRAAGSIPPTDAYMREMTALPQCRPSCRTWWPT